ncbi:MAG: IS1595 family transposase, partial [Patescibacteria group bacterium]
FNGLTDDMFKLHLKESEFRWNHRGEIYDILLKEVRKNPL